MVTSQVLGEGNGTPLQYTCRENPLYGEAWWVAAHGVAKSQTRLRNFTFTFIGSSTWNYLFGFPQAVHNRGLPSTPTIFSNTTVSTTLNEDGPLAWLGGSFLFFP